MDGTSPPCHRRCPSPSASVPCSHERRIDVTRSELKQWNNSSSGIYCCCSYSFGYGISCVYVVAVLQKQRRKSPPIGSWKKEKKALLYPGSGVVSLWDSSFLSALGPSLPIKECISSTDCFLRLWITYSGLTTWTTGLVRLPPSLTIIAATLV